jgi:hypothetical protein
MRGCSRRLRCDSFAAPALAAEPAGVPVTGRVERITFADPKLPARQSGARHGAFGGAVLAGWTARARQRRDRHLWQRPAPSGSK